MLIVKIIPKMETTTTISIRVKPLRIEIVRNLVGVNFLYDNYFFWKSEGHSSSANILKSEFLPSPPSFLSFPNVTRE